MKTFVVGVLLLCAALPLFAQAQDGIYIYVPPITGDGSAPEDNDFFHNLLTNELEAWNFSVAEGPDKAAYALVGTLAPSEGAENRFLLLLALQDNNGATLQEQGLNYSTADEAYTLIPTLLYNIFSNVFEMNTYRPVEDSEENPWRNQPWYMGVGVFWNPRMYYGDRLAVNRANYAFGLSAEYHFQNFMSAGTGIELAGEYVAASPSPSSDQYNNVILQIPLLIKYVWRPANDKFMHEPYAGILFNIPLFPDTVPSLLSWALGFQFGMKAGPGVAYADTHYSMDFMPSRLNKNNPADTRQYHRYMLYLGVGYKYNLVTPIITAIKARNKKKIPERPSQQKEFAADEAAPPPEEVIEIEEELAPPEEVIETEEELAPPEEVIEIEEELALPEDVVETEEEVALPEEVIETEEELAQPEEVIEIEEELALPEEVTETEEEVALPEEITESGE